MQKGRAVYMIAYTKARNSHTAIEGLNFDRALSLGLWHVNVAYFHGGESRLRVLAGIPSGIAVSKILDGGITRREREDLRDLLRQITVAGRHGLQQRLPQKRRFAATFGACKQRETAIATGLQRQGLNSGA